MPRVGDPGPGAPSLTSDDPGASSGTLEMDRDMMAGTFCESLGAMRPAVRIEFDMMRDENILFCVVLLCCCVFCCGMCVDVLTNHER